MSAHIAGLGSYDGLDEVMDHDRGAGGTTPRTQLLRQGEYGQGLSGRQPRSAPPITPLRMSRRIQVCTACTLPVSQPPTPHSPRKGQ